MPGQGPRVMRETSRERPGAGSAGRPGVLGDPGIPGRGRVQVPRRGRAGECWSTRSTGRGEKERKARPPTGGPPRPGLASPSGKGVREAGPRRRPRAEAASAHRLPPPSPSQPGAQGPGEAGEGPVWQPPQGAQTRPAVRPLFAVPVDPALPTHTLPGRDGHNPRRPAGGGARDPPTDRPLPPTPGAGQGGGRGREGSGDREAGPRRGRRRNSRLPPRQGRRDVRQTLVSRADFQ